jgi:anti-sigma regulatory factor (Ser/Thr protein kinase)
MVPAARAFVRAFLDSHPLAGDAEIVASEYVTNAIRHTASGQGGAIYVTVAATALTARIEVTDHGNAAQPGAAAPPSARAPLPVPHRDGGAGDDENGRGLLIVDCLATHWGHFGTAGGKVTAWAELGEPGESEPGEPAAQPERAEPEHAAMEPDRDDSADRPEHDSDIRGAAHERGACDPPYESGGGS